MSAFGRPTRFTGHTLSSILVLMTVGGCGEGSGAPPCGVRAISASGGHTCAVLAEGGVRCWGSNEYGQLGDGATANRAVPTPRDVLTDVVAIGTGTAYSCALTSAGGVRCWGYNGDGQLGDGTVDARLTAPTTDVLTGVAAIAVGAAHTCALLNTGGVRCWGRNQAGQLGDGTLDGRLSPPTTDVVSGVKAIAAGGSHTCALMADSGGVRCWGLNVAGQLGDGTTRDRPVPPADDVITNVRSISAGDVHTCALTNARGVRCWGHNINGELGTGSYDPVSAPLPTDVLTDALAVAAGFNFTCALRSMGGVRGGGVRCWGYNSDGQLGDETELNVDRLLPPDFDVLTGAEAITVGTGHTCALMKSGGVRCWGANDLGQLGDGRAPAYSMFAPSTDVEGLDTTCR